MRTICRKIKEIMPLWAAISCLALALTLTVYLVGCLSPAFADGVNSTVSYVIRAGASLMTYIFPFSLFEMGMILLIPSLAILAFFLIRWYRRGAKPLRIIFSLIGVISIIASSYLLTLAIAYKTTPIEERMELDASLNITEDELFSVCVYLRDEVNELAQQNVLDGGETVMPINSLELGRELTRAYSSLKEEYGFIQNLPSRGKHMIFSGVMADCGLSGIYTFFTGEANVSTEYPDYNIPFTTAHEMAHQRGIIREDEANFIAFIVTSRSDDPYVRYSGYLNMLEYTASSLWRSDEEMYYEVMSGLDEIAKNDIRASRAVSQSHSDSLLNKITDKANDAYLKANGTEGVVSYGMAVRLIVAYFKR